jgi:cell wall-associated NlpC family hydrolase
VFFRTSSRRKVSHVGLYIGDGRFIHASSRGNRIRIDSFNGGYYRRRLVGARHFL